MNPPGSPFKVVTAYAALTQDVYGPAGPMTSPEQSIPDVGKYTLPRCDEESGTCVFSSPFNGERSVNLEEAITVSSDVYFYRLAAEGFFDGFGHEVLHLDRRRAHILRPDRQGWIG